MGQMYFPGEGQNGKEEYGIAWGRVFFSIVVGVLVGYGVYWLVASCSSSESEDDVATTEVVLNEPEEEVVTEEVMEEVEEVIPPFNFETYRFYISNEDAEIELKADFPLGKSLVADSVRQYINNMLSDEYYNDQNDGEDMINYFGKAVFNEYAQMHQECEDNSELFDDSPFSLKKEITVTCLEEKYVTYLCTFYKWTGGVHGMDGEMGVTFNRLNGTRVNYLCFINLESRSFKRIIKEGLKRYFQNNDWAASDDEELAECLLNVENVNNIPLPSAEPYFTPKGVCFKYCSYEIASYAAGFPSFVLPYDEARPYMTEEALDLIGDTETIVAE